MPNVLRDKKGLIIAISQDDVVLEGWEQLSSGSKEYLDYLDAALKKENLFRESDIQLARVLEDLVAILIDRDLIHFTDFPEAAQKRLIHRQGLRSKGKKLDLLDEDII